MRDSALREQLSQTLLRTDFPFLGKRYEGKVRDNYTLRGKRYLIATDRISAFDRVLGTIPFKGQVLNQLAQFWFEQSRKIPNHVVSVPDPNVMLCRECAPFPVEMVVRQYITGVTATSAWFHYQRGEREFCGHKLPEGLKKDQKLHEPILTPSTKAEHGGHDESVSSAEVLRRKLVSPEDFAAMSEMAFKLFALGQKLAAKRGLILVDTKYEFGRAPSGEIVVIDEIHTPDSSRYWYAAEYDALFSAGEEQKKLDKEYVRSWLAERGFVGEGAVPALPDEVRIEAARRYIAAYETLTGQQFQAQPGSVAQRIETALRKVKP